MAAPGTGTEPIRVGIIGYGLAGSVFHAPLIASTPGMMVAGIVTSNAARQEQARLDYPAARIFARAGEMFSASPPVELVVVASPNSAHVSLGTAALEAGAHVVVDKPLAASSTDGERILVAAKQAGKVFTVFQNRRWDNDFLTLRRLMATDALGPVTRFESRFERFRPAVKQDAWREHADPAEAGGLLFDLGAHLIDQACVLFGSPVSIYAEVDTRRTGAAVDDDTFVALRFAGGELAHLWMSVLSRQSGPRFRVVGLNGQYVKSGLDPQEEALRTGARPGDEGWGQESPEAWGTLFHEMRGLSVVSRVETLPGSYESYYAQVRDAVRGSGPPPVDPADSIRVLRIIEAAQQSAKSGSVVNFAG